MVCATDFDARRAASLADGKAVALEETGRLLVVEATAGGHTPVAQAQFLGGRGWSLPALAQGRLYLRNAAGEGVCLDLAGPGSPR